MSETKSFHQIILMPNERVTGTPTPFAHPWPTPTPCPTVAYVLEAREAPLTPEIMKTWFINAIIPLVGKCAADAMCDRIRADDRGWDEFLAKAIEFRKSLVK